MIQKRYCTTPSENKYTFEGFFTSPINKFFDVHVHIPFQEMSVYTSTHRAVS